MGNGVTAFAWLAGMLLGFGGAISGALGVMTGLIAGGVAGKGFFDWCCGVMSGAAGAGAGVGLGAIAGPTGSDLLGGTKDALGDVFAGMLGGRTTDFDSTGRAGAGTAGGASYVAGVTGAGLVVAGVVAPACTTPGLAGATGA